MTTEEFNTTTPHIKQINIAGILTKLHSQLLILLEPQLRNVNVIGQNRKYDLVIGSIPPTIVLLIRSQSLTRAFVTLQGGEKF